MRALVLHTVGDEPVLEEDFAQPEGEGVVPVIAAGLNPVDLIMTGPMFADHLPVPRVVGMEAVVDLAGVPAYVEAVAWTHGSCAEFTVVDPTTAIALPDGLEPSAAFALGVSGLAGWLCLTAVQLSRGESVVVLGATGAVGQVAVRAAVLRGAGRVTAVGRDAEVLHRLGVASAPVTDTESVTKALADADVVVVAASPLTPLALANAPGARIVTVAAPPGTEGVVTYNNFDRPHDEKRDAFLTMARHVLAGELVVPTRTYPLDDALTPWRLQAASPHCKQVIAIA